MTAFHLDPGHMVAGRYRILRPLAEGGMGEIYVAEHRLLGRQVALKVLRREFGQQPALVQRFLREARTASSIHNPHIVEILDVGVDGDDGRGVFYVMELLDGEDLACLLNRLGPLPWPRVRHMLGQLCIALAAVHARGIIHRDLKPANILRLSHPGDDDAIKLLDFGIAKSMVGEHTLTAVGEVIGTPSYMAPEQILGEAVDHRTDLYAVGVLAYQLLTGQLPFKREHPRELLAAILSASPPPMAQVAPTADIPHEAQTIVERAMHREPALRFPDAQALAAALDLPISAPAEAPAPLPLEALALDDLTATRLHLRTPQASPVEHDPTLPAPTPAIHRRGRITAAALASLSLGLIWVAFTPSSAPLPLKPTQDMPPPSPAEPTPAEPTPTSESPGPTPAPSSSPPTPSSLTPARPTPSRPLPTATRPRP